MCNSKWQPILIRQKQCRAQGPFTCDMQIMWLVGKPKTIQVHFTLDVEGLKDQKNLNGCQRYIASLNMIHIWFTRSLRAHQLQYGISISHERPLDGFQGQQKKCSSLEFVNGVRDLVPCHSNLNTIVLKYVRILLIGHPKLSGVGPCFYLRAYTKKIHVMMRLSKLHTPSYVQQLTRVGPIRPFKNNQYVNISIVIVGSHLVDMATWDWLDQLYLVRKCRHLTTFNQANLDHFHGVHNEHMSPCYGI